MTYTRRHPLIAVVNHSTVVSDADVATALAALQHQITFDFQPRWNAGATLLQVDGTPVGTIRDLAADYKIDAAAHVALAIPAGAWLLVIADDSDQAGALGYHEIDPNTIPLGYVFAKTDQHYGLSWTVTASHELLEMLGDPLANQVVQIKQDGTALAYETADAVEADQDGYQINGVLVSDFVYPNWFVPGSTGPWDYRGLLKSALELRPGGYIAVWRPGKGWTQATAQGLADAHDRPYESKPRHDQGPRFRMRAEHRAAPDSSQLPEWLA